MRNPPTRTPLRRLAAGLAVPVVVLLAALPAAAATSTPRAHAHSAADTGTAAVTVAAGTDLATVPSTAVGLNASTYDTHVTDSAVPGLVKDAGVGLMRFPGGTQSDTYDWQSSTDIVSGAHLPTDFDDFTATAAAAGAQTMVTVDYGTGDRVGATRSPAESGAQVAADWVRYANVEHHDHVQYWEIGNEVYGNGTYGGSWEPDDHCGSTFPPPTQPDSCGPAVYARTAAGYIRAMKAVDPTIKVGVVLTAPGSWPDGITAPGSPEPWNQTVLDALGSSVDFADVHWYPQNPSNVTPPGPTDAGLLADTAQIPDITASLRSEFGQYAGDADLPIMLTETNSVSSNPGKQTLSVVNALYLVQDYAQWTGNGVANVDWWQLHNGIVTGGDNGADLAGSAQYGDYGVLSDGSCGAAQDGTQLCEPAADTAFPAYYGLKLAGAFLHPGDTVVKAASSAPLVQAYAVKSAGGGLKVMLVNDDPSTTYSVALDYTGFTPGSGAPATATLTSPATGITAGTAGSATAQTLPPYTATMLTLSPAASGSATCKVAYSVNDWGTGFTGTVTVTDTGDRPVGEWVLGFSWPGNQRIDNGWSATWAQSGAQVTATAPPWNTTLQPGASATLGFNASYSGTNAPPSSFTLNGAPCTTG
ncbi:Cellulose binding domain-containing protein [Actinacidiphila yanglinensis]|uniref:Cellulose binding domain-containing protein n=1 Tax=Actinacidiphila yanglinensis TaxID=310779 RepID=A0A1H6C5T8_9ACTN|nr:cellulose binding domain-containing protein [Actinacidiphila yanglinensis]SEG68107.1 Cellulose binding domain-containing protein [Actinacidiphila yanglinensis]